MAEPALDPTVGHLLPTIDRSGAVFLLTAWWHGSLHHFAHQRDERVDAWFRARGCTRISVAAVRKVDAVASPKTRAAYIADFEALATEIDRELAGPPK